METEHSLVEILLAEGQLKLYFALTIFSRECFGQRPMETQHFLVEILLAKGQLQLFMALTIFSREYFGKKPIETGLS